MTGNRNNEPQVRRSKLIWIVRDWDCLDPLEWAGDIDPQGVSRLVDGHGQTACLRIGIFFIDERHTFLSNHCIENDSDFVRTGHAAVTILESRECEFSGL